MDFGLIQTFSKAIIRPPRFIYDKNELGKCQFEFKNKVYQRKDFRVINRRKHKLQCSIFRDKYSPQPRLTIILLHANSSSRLSVRNYLALLLEDFDVVAFDFSGAGISEGNYITLGYHQMQDLRDVIERMYQLYKITEIVLWGRSMGAATALLFAGKHPNHPNITIRAIICDSAFSDLEMVINQLSETYLPISFSFLVNACMDSMQKYIDKQVNYSGTKRFELRKLKPIDALKKIKKVPIFFIGSKHDKLVNVTHTKRLYQECKSQKQLRLLDGGHNEQRSEEAKQEAVDFIKKVCIQCKPRKKIFISKNRNSYPEFTSNDPLVEKFNKELSPQQKRMIENLVLWKSKAAAEMVDSEKTHPMHPLKRCSIEHSPQLMNTSNESPKKRWSSKGSMQKQIKQETKIKKRISININKNTQQINKEKDIKEEINKEKQANERRERYKQTNEKRYKQKRKVEHSGNDKVNQGSTNEIGKEGKVDLIHWQRRIKKKNSVASNLWVSEKDISNYDTSKRNRLSSESNKLLSPIQLQLSPNPQASEISLNYIETLQANQKNQWKDKLKQKKQGFQEKKKRYKIFN